MVEIVDYVDLGKRKCKCLEVTVPLKFMACIHFNHEIQAILGF